MAYTTIDDPGLYFNTVLHTGNGSSQSITGVGFSPDWVWLKVRSITGDHGVFDTVRGTTKFIRTNKTNAEATSDSISSFDADGFTLQAGWNDSGQTFASWNWLAGGTASSNTDGDVTTSVSASTTAGFSICGFTEAGSAPYSFGHGLGVEPDMVWFKSRGSGSWQIYFKALGSPSGKLLQLDNTNNPNTAST